MKLQEVLEIKEEKSKLTKDMTFEQLKEYYSKSMQEYYKIIGKTLDNGVDRT